ncbi:hypothetical protein DFH09DRAFT_1314141 [Mycena vulgaris]|nr:hypothetical protein DFH09DRAFT_1314141 [Mycena vulgaris]
MPNLNAFQLEALKKMFPMTANAAAAIDGSSGVDLTEHQLQRVSIPLRIIYPHTPIFHRVLKKQEHNEKARIRIAKRRAELKARSSDEQEAHAEKERAYKAKYREACVAPPPEVGRRTC